MNFKPVTSGELDTAVDARLVERARQGQMAGRHEAFSVLVKRYEGFVRAMLYALCANRSEADDLAQDAFVVAWQKLGSLKSPERFRGWLKQLAYRQFLHRYRRTRREQQYLVQAQHESAVGDESFPGETASHDARALLRLCAPLEQELLVLCHGFEFTYAEIAQNRGMAVGTVKSHVHRAKQKIRSALESRASSDEEIHEKQ